MTPTDFFDFTSTFTTEICVLTSQQKFSCERIDWVKKLMLNPQSLAIPIQIHSNNVIWIDTPGNYNNCDGLFTSNPQVLLSLQTADCVPFFLYDVKEKIRGLVHAGWRGIVGGIINNGIALMLTHQCKMETIHILLGPAICKGCYEVGVEVAEKFDAGCKVKGEKGKWFVNLHGQLKTQLLKYGIPEINISTSDICTFENQDCCSYRRDGENAGRMYSFMGVKDGFN